MGLSIGIYTTRKADSAFSDQHCIAPLLKMQQAGVTLVAIEVVVDGDSHQTKITPIEPVQLAAHMCP